MGLDGAEIIMTVEDQYGVQIDPSIEGKILTPRHLHELTLSLLKQKFASNPERVPSEDEVWQKIQKIIADVIGIPIERVTKDARLVEDLGLD